MTLHLLRVGVNMTALHRFAVARRLDDDDLGYALHAASIARYGAAAPRPFRFLPDHPRGSHLLGYLTEPDALFDAAALPLADESIADVFTGAPQVQVMPAHWREGARFGFEVRVRPVVRFGKRARAARGERDGTWQPRAGEIDAYVAACERAVLAGGDVDAIGRDHVYTGWLEQRIAGAATLEQVTLRDFRRTRTRRSTHAGTGARTRAIEGPDAVMTGTLSVRDPAAFADLLARGVGRHAGFGFGMLLLAPATRGG